MNCQYCKNEFTTISSLNNHQKNAKYCLLLQNKSNSKFTCICCNKQFSSRYALENHEDRYKDKKINVEDLKQEILTLKESNEHKDKLIEQKDFKIKELQEHFNTIINKININNTDIKDNQVDEFSNCKIDKDIEIHKIDTNKDIEINNKKIQNITELFKNNIINLKEYKELLIEF
jgi:hypothetical protein